MKKNALIPFKPLFNDMWVFFIYGFIAALFIEVYVSKNASLDDIEAVIFEPFSIRAFLLISSTGFFLVALRSFILGMDEEKASNCKWMNRFFVPISEVGLSAGFIIMGMSLGIMTYFITFGANVEGAHDFALLNLKIVMLIAFIIVPVYCIQRTMFATNKIEKIALPLIMFTYIASVCSLQWFADPKDFWRISILTGIVLLGALLGTKYFAKKALQRTNR